MVAVQLRLKEIQEDANRLSLDFNHSLGELDQFVHQQMSLSSRCIQEVINSRMRPFSDAVEAFPRMVRDLSHQMGKKVRLEIEGLSTLVDRDILEILEAPLSHLLRNAVDHGIEFPDERIAAGKPAEGLIKLEASHRGGMLAMTLTDDGYGIDTQQLRRKLVDEKLLSEEESRHLTQCRSVKFSLFTWVFDGQTGDRGLWPWHWLECRERLYSKWEERSSDSHSR